MPVIWADVDQDVYTELSYLATLRQIPVQALAGILLRASAAKLYAQVREASEPRVVVRRLLRELEQEGRQGGAGAG